MSCLYFPKRIGIHGYGSGVCFPAMNLNLPLLSPECAIEPLHYDLSSTGTDLVRANGMVSMCFY